MLPNVNAHLDFFFSPISRRMIDGKIRGKTEEGLRKFHVTFKPTEALGEPPNGEMSAHLSGSLLVHVRGRHVTNAFARRRTRGPNERRRRRRLMELSSIISGAWMRFGLV